MKPFRALVFAVSMLASSASFADFWHGMEAYNTNKFGVAMAEFLPLAERGSPEAQLMVALLHRHGKGVPVNHQIANAWYRKSASGGNATAQWSLGGADAHGAGLPRDLVLAHFLYHLGKEGGDSDAATEFPDMARRMTRQQIAESDALYAEWKVGMPIPTNSISGRITSSETNSGSSGPTRARSR